MNPIRYTYDGQGVIKADGRKIARDNPHNEQSGEDLRDLVRRANVAPDLLAACEATLSLLDHMTTDAFSKGADKPARDRLRAAIAKATGQ